MRLRYRLTRGDIFRAGLRSIVWNPIVYIFIPFLAFAWWRSFNSGDMADAPVAVRMISATLVIVMTALGGLLGGAVVAAANAFMVKEDRGVLGEHTLEITDEGLVESTSVNRTLLNWRTPFRIRHTKRYGFIFLSPFNSHPVPKLVPPLEGSTPEFLTELQRRIAANKQA